MTTIDLSDVTVIISVKTDSPARRANIERLHSFYTTVGAETDILVVAQPPLPDLGPRPGLKVHEISDDGLHWKTRNMNIGAAFSARPYLLMSDADTVPCPKALVEALKLVVNGAGFVSLYNGIVVNLPPPTAAPDWSRFFDALPHYDRQDVAPGQAAKHPEFPPLYGNAAHMAIGGCFLCARQAFVSTGGWNPNFVSYGFEDQELHHRVQKLGYDFPALQDFNLYHFDHPRGMESRYGQFYRQNHAEFDRVCAMDAETLASYVARGFRQMTYESGYDYARFATSDADGWHRIADRRTDLGELTILILADAARVPRDSSCIEPLLDHLEQNFRGYDLRLCEIGATEYKYPTNRQNVAYSTISEMPSKDELKPLLVESNRPSVFFLRLSDDAAGQLRFAKAQLARVAQGASVSEVFPASIDAVTDGG